MDLYNLISNFMALKTVMHALNYKLHSVKSEIKVWQRGAHLPLQISGSLLNNHKWIFLLFHK